MSPKENFIVTLAMVVGCWFCACFVPSIGDAITLTGATTNPIVGFILPCMFYLRVFPESAWWKKAIAWVVLTIAIFGSVAILVIFVIDKSTPS